MELTLANKLVEQNSSLTVHENYSGRNMNGEETIAVYGSAAAYYDACINLAQIGDITDEEIEELDNIRKDHFGRTDLIFY